MGTYTAQILVGRTHQNHGGILPDLECQVFLNENDVPYWVLQRSSRRENRGRRIRWIPASPASILEDGILFCALQALRCEDLLALAPSDLTRLDTLLVDLQTVDTRQLSHLRDACRGHDFGDPERVMFVFSLLEGSAISFQLDGIQNYNFDCEVLTSRFRRSFSAWTGDTTSSGSLG